MVTEYDLTKPVQRKIKERMDQLQEWMESNYHLKSPEDVEELITSVSKFWSVMVDEDKDYIHGARHAIEEKVSWNV